jgi:small subunit ribosomal protein S17
MAHDEGNTCKEGEIIEIIETRPISKNKRFKVLKK